MPAATTYIELIEPILNGIHWNNAQNFSGFGKLEEDINKTNQLQCFAEPHGVC